MLSPHSASANRISKTGAERKFTFRCFILTPTDVRTRFGRCSVEILSRGKRSSGRALPTYQKDVPVRFSAGAAVLSGPTSKAWSRPAPGRQLLPLPSPAGPTTVNARRRFRQSFAQVFNSRRRRGPRRELQETAADGAGVHRNRQFFFPFFFFPFSFFFFFFSFFLLLSGFLLFLLSSRRS